MLFRKQGFLVLIFVTSWKNNESTKCDFFKNITLRLRPRSKFPYPNVYEVSNFSGCIEKTSFDEPIRSIVIFDQYVTSIGDHAINDMPELERLSFRGCKIKNISRFSFRSVPKLKEVYIQFGDLEKMEMNIFNEISNLEILNLHGNKIYNIQVYAFGFMEALKQVIVSKNKLNHLYGIWFANSSNIDLLDFSENQITNITRFVFPRMLKLKDIFLDYNEIEFIEAGAFENLKNLTYLGLSHNRLVELNPKVFPDKFHIESLMINANYLNFLANELLMKLSLKEVTLEGNPWKCPCLDKIHKWLFQTKASVKTTNFCRGDSIPRCFYSDEDRFCSETNNKEMTKSYLKTLKGLNIPIDNLCANL